MSVFAASAIYYPILGCFRR